MDVSYMFGLGLRFLIFIFLSIGFLAKPVIANDIFTAQRLLDRVGICPRPDRWRLWRQDKKSFCKTIY